MNRHLYRKIVMACIAWLVLTLAGVQPYARARAAEQLCFKEVRYCISGRIREYWEQNGGLPVFGYPITELREELNPDTDTIFWTQWFERGRLELHPENQPPYDVLLGRIGVGLLEAQGRSWQSFPKTEPSAPHYFPETGHAIAEIFWPYWSSHGLDFDGQPGSSFAESLALFGMPISEPFVEQNGSGHRVLSQWFERGRFESHPHYQAPYDVLLGLLGNELRSYFPCCGGIVFSSDRDDPRGELYRMQTDRSALRRLTSSPGADVQPTFSPNGQWIAFISDRDGDPEIFVMSTDGSNLRQLTHNDAREASPAWSPDGSQLAFESDRDRPLSTFDLYVMQSDGSQQRRLTDDPANDSCPAWANNGRIGFSREDTIYTIGADGAGLSELFRGGRCPRWGHPLLSSNIAVTIQEGSSSYIATMNRDGSGLTRLTTSGLDRDPVWSSDTRYIAFSSTRNGNAEIYTIDTFGMREFNMTAHGAGDTGPSWQPFRTKFGPPL